MKTTKGIVLGITCLSLFFASCKKDNKNTDSYKCTTCKTVPDALAANDASNKGIYEGIVIGSSGTIQFDLQNGGNTIGAKLVIDGVTVNLTADVSIQNGQTYIAPFTGTLNGQPVTINFSVGPAGQEPSVVSSSIPGHPNAVFTIYKETSSNLIECFEGTYNTTRPETGIFNLILSRTLKGYAGNSRAVTGSTGTSSFDGIIDASNRLVDNGRIMGTLNGDVISGTFTDSESRTVNISAQRNL